MRSASVAPSRRSDSPIFNYDGNSKVPQFRTDENKIHRIRCLVPYWARIVNVVSPSEIWIQHLNHISENLTEFISADSKPINSGSLEKGMYVMAKLDESILARARILDFKNNKVSVRFLDYGSIAVFRSNEFFKMSRNLRTYPWQTVAVALCDVMPQNGIFWSENEIESFKIALNEYDIFWIRPQMTQYKIIDDSVFTRVTMFGLLPSDVDEIENSPQSDFDLGHSIAEKYYIVLSSRSCCPLPIIDAFDQKSYPVEYEFYEKSQVPNYSNSDF